MTLKAKLKGGAGWITEEINLGACRASNKRRREKNKEEARMIDSRIYLWTIGQNSTVHRSSQ